MKQKLKTNNFQIILQKERRKKKQHWKPKSTGELNKKFDDSTSQKNPSYYKRWISTKGALKTREQPFPVDNSTSRAKLSNKKQRIQKKIKVPKKNWSKKNTFFFQPGGAGSSKDTTSSFALSFCTDAAIFHLPTWSNDDKFH